jgi:hypothetical protein
MRQPISGTNRPSWWPTRPPEDLPEDFLEDLVQPDIKTWLTRQDTVDFDQSRSTGYGKMCNIDLDLLVVTDQESGNRPHPLANIRWMRRPLVQHTQSPSNTNRRTGRSVLLSRGPNRYKLVMFSVFHLLVRNLRVLSIRFHLAEQLNHMD